MAAFSEGRGALKGGKSWFAVESKTFEISIEEIQGKLRGVILERSKGFSSSIKFGKKSFNFLLEGVETGAKESQARGALKFGKKEEENIGWSVVQMMPVGICYAQ